MEKFGLNLFSLHDLKDKVGLSDLAKQIKSLGYGFVQFSGFPIEVEKIKDSFLSIGLDVVLTHSPWERIKNDRDKLIAEHLQFGCNKIGLGIVPGDYYIGTGKFTEFVSEFQSLAEDYKKSGIDLYYHNHSIEFEKLSNGQTGFDYMIENAPDVKFTFDTYWAQAGGVSVLEYVDKLKGRTECVHLKDYKVTEWQNKFCALGDGNVNFGKIIPQMAKNGVKYFIVEQDDAGSYERPFDELEKSANYLKKFEI